MSENAEEQKCLKRKCSKFAGHAGKCNKKAEFNFWKQSPVIITHQVRSDICELTQKKSKLEDLNEGISALCENKVAEIHIAERRGEDLAAQNTILLHEKVKLDQDLQKLNKKFDKLKLLIEQKQFGKTKRENAPTDLNTIKDTSNSTKYARQNETKCLLEYIHGGATGALYGAWDFLSRYASKEMIEEFMLAYKRGKFLGNLYGKFSTTFSKSDQAINQAVAQKYHTFCSRRKFKFSCKIQSSTFDPLEQRWSSKVIYYGDQKINLREKPLSDYAVTKFVQNLDIGEIHNIPGFCGVSRSVTALVTMVIDLHLRVPSLEEKLIWFNNIQNHFVVEFSDDGAPECKDTTMSIGSLTLWNLGGRARSREYHYPLHTVSCGEKEDVLACLWMQHTDEMLLIEDSILTIGGRQVTVEFQPSADQAWQFWANNELTQSATYPSMFAKVHKGELNIVGASFAEKWEIPTMDTRVRDIKMLEDFNNGLCSSLSESSHKKKKLTFMAENGLRQLGFPRINKYADRQRPEPLHLEINNWEHALDLLYKECVRRGAVQIDMLVEILKTKISDGGCGLKSVADDIKAHYEIESTRHNKLSNRLIGAQTITIANYGLRAVDILYTDGESELERFRRCCISKIFQTLRSIGTLINSVSVTNTYVNEITELCTLYFNLFSLCFGKLCNSTVWTLGYVVPYHTKLLYEQYKIGYGILSMQGKEAKNSEIKQQLKSCTNRSKSETGINKWHQYMRSSYVRTFYLPYHYPIKSYSPHFQSRNPPVCENSCDCYRLITNNHDRCETCIYADRFINYVQAGKLPEFVIEITSPFLCGGCQCRFPDSNGLAYHNCTNNKIDKNIIPKDLKVSELKKILTERGESTTGSKDVLCKRVESLISFGDM